MNNIARMVCRDLRRFWPLAIVAASLAFFLAFFPTLGLTGANSSLIGAAESVRLIVVGLMAVVVVQEDLVMSDRADWLTRPMRASEVLAAKLLFLTVFLVAPFGVITVAGALQYDLGAAASAVVARGYVAQLLVTTVFFALVGAMTPSLLSAVIAFVSTAAATFILQPYLSLLTAQTGVATSVDSIRSVVLLVAALLLAAVLGYHYTQRQWRRTIWAGAAALALTLGFARWIVRFPPAKGLPAGLTVTVKNPRGFVGNALLRPFPFGNQAVIGMELILSTPSDADYYVYGNHARFESPNGRDFSQRIPGDAWIPSFGSSKHGINTPWNSYPHAAQSEFGVSLGNSDPVSIQTIMALPIGAFTKLRGANGRLDLSLTAGKRFVSERGQLALEAGATAYFPGYRITIDSVRFASGDSIDVATRTINVRSRSSSDMAYFALVNNRTNEVSLEEYGHGYAYSITSYLLRDYPRSVNFSHRWHRDSGKMERGISSEWLKSARLGFYSLKWQSALGTAELITPDFAMPTIGGVQ